jgi:hypothetical protein
MIDRWLVQLSSTTGKESAWTFSSKSKAEEFLEERYNLTKHLGYDPDEVYYLLPIE